MNHQGVLQWFSLLVILLGIEWPVPVLAQSIRAAQDGTRTQVNRQGDRYTITGGSRSADRRNLFHSFEQFGLEAQEIASFASSPEIQNILARVTGGDRSLINGLLQVSDGSSNLYLMNPAGILFGANARLDLPAAFHATTATGIGFGDGRFQAIGDNDYTNLVSDPTNFAFALDQPGAIVNAGSLRVGVGQQLSLLGGTVINTGTLTAPGGRIVMAAVPGQSRVRISQATSPLSLEISTLDQAEPTLPFTPLSLPALLTGGDLANAMGLTIDANGVVRLTSSGTGIPPGTGWAIAAGQLQASAEGSPDALAMNGGNVLLWGASGAGLLGEIAARGGVMSGDGGWVDVSSPGAIAIRGSIDVSAPQGRGGTVLLDPQDIVIQSGFGDSVDVDGNPSLFTGAPGGGARTILAGDTAPSVIFESEIEGITGGNIVLEATRNIRIDPLFDGSLSVGGGSNIRFTADADQDGVGSFSMRSTDTIATSGSDITITGADITAGNLRTSNLNGGDIRLSTRNTTTGLLQGGITVNALEARGFSVGQGGNITLEGDSIQVTGFTATPGVSIDTRSTSTNGTIAITHAGGLDNLPFAVGVASANGTVGSIAATGILSSGSFPVLAAGGNAVIPGNPVGIAIDSVNSAPTLTVPPVLNGTQDRALTLSFSDLFPTPSTNLVDSDTDNVVVQINSITPNARLTRGTQVLAAGDVITPGDILTYTPPPNVTGIQTAFTVQVQDLDNGTGFLSRSAPVAVQANLVAAPPLPIAPAPRPTAPPRPRPRPTRSPLAVPPSSPLDDSVPIISMPGLPTDGDLESSYLRAEQRSTTDFTRYLGIAPPPPKSLPDAKALASDIEEATGVKPAFLYLNFVPASLSDSTASFAEPTVQRDDELELLLVSKQGVIRKRVPSATRALVLAAVKDFQREITDVRQLRTQRYLPLAQQLYQWLVAPVAGDLQQQAIANLVFLPETRLRSLPFAALHDGQKFLIQTYSTGLMPSLSLTDTRYVDIQHSRMLAMGVSESTQGQVPLPAVPTELNLLALKLWQGEVFLNQEATLENLRKVRSQQSFGIVHLATHANFLPGAFQSSYIQLWNEKLHPDQIRNLGWNDPPVELLVLSACQTALGDDSAEMGLAGLAIQTGVKTAVASLWYVSDDGTASLISGFYQALNHSPIKAEALRQAQAAMATGQIFVENGIMRGIPGVENFRLPSGTDLSAEELSHPYYWASFTMLGSPW
ncbi:MAG: CHAT domain-containing protein [Oculatellaceae cyanobacterium Prado106]|nr:CHAT domain-containing protein [Oculatellaceae cyanobacterium Prado106]